MSKFKRAQTIFSVLFALLLLSACSNQPEEQVIEQVDETETNTLEGRVQQFFDVVSSAWENGDYDTVYSSWENYWAYGDEDKELYQKEFEYMTKGNVKYNLKLAEIEEIASYEEDGITYMKVLVDVHLVVEDEEKIEYKGKAYAYVAAANTDLGFIMDDDIEFLED